jgi:hypothetical protein
MLHRITAALARPRLYLAYVRLHHAYILQSAPFLRLEDGASSQNVRPNLFLDGSLLLEEEGILVHGAQVVRR